MNLDRLASFLLNIAQILNHIIPKGKDHIVFYSYPDFTDNCRAMYEKMCEVGADKKYNITWVVRDVKSCREKHKGIKFVKHRSLDSLWAWWRSHYIIRTHSYWGNRYIPNRQVMCVAWHGMAIKGFSKSDFLSKHNTFDHFCVTSIFFAKMFSKALNADLDRFDITGFPRNDLLFEDASELKTILGLNSFDKIILWMPTFRAYGDGNLERQKSEFGLPTLHRRDLEVINESLEKLNYCLILKLHPWALDSVGELNYTNIREIKNEDIPEPFSLYHFIGETDALISDYSSVWGDYLLTDKPIGFAFDDLEQYKKTRCMDLDPYEEYLPGKRIKNAKDLIAFINSLDSTDNFTVARERIRNLFLFQKDNKSSERFLEAIGIL